MIVSSERRIALVDVGERELDVVREEQPNAAELVLQRQRLALELDLVVAEDLRPNVRLGGDLHVRMAELEDDLGVPGRETVLVGDAAPQDEGVVVEPEVRRVHEEDFADLERRVDELVRREPDVVLGGRPLHDLREVEEALARHEVVGSQDELALEVLDLVERKAVRVLARLRAAAPAGPGLRSDFFAGEIEPS